MERGQLERAVSTVSSEGELRRLGSHHVSLASCRDMRMMATSRSDMSAVFDSLHISAGIIQYLEKMSTRIYSDIIIRSSLAVVLRHLF